MRGAAGNGGPYRDYFFGSSHSCRNPSAEWTAEQIGEGDTYEEVLADVRSAIRFHIETFGNEVLQAEPPVLEAFVAEAGVTI